MHNKLETYKKSFPRIMRTVVLLGCVAAILNGCALLYFPMLLFVPLQPIVMLAVKVAARYGPLLLMLVVDADPQLPGAPDTIIAVQPAQFTPQTQLEDLETRLVYETTHTPGLVSAAIVDINSMTEEWLQERVSEATRNGHRIRLVFVDSRNYRNGNTLSEATQILLANSGVPLWTAGPLAAQVGGRSARETGPEISDPDDFSAAAYASLAGAALPEL